jgi:hypothetical protein
MVFLGQKQSGRGRGLACDSLVHRLLGFRCFYFGKFKFKFGLAALEVAFQDISYGIGQGKDSFTVYEIPGLGRGCP